MKKVFVLSLLAFTLTLGSISQMIEFKTYVNGETIEDYYCDGDDGRDDPRKPLWG